MLFHKMRVAHVFPSRIPVNWTLFFLSVLAAAVNLTKAVHIDDTAYLEMARAIIRNPLHPLSEQLNWENTARPIFETNQPLLIPAVLAIWILVVGENEVLLHLPIALCSAAVIFLFFRLARQLECASPLYLTALFALGPAFLVGQNLMVDMPLMMFFLVFFCSLCAPVAHKSERYWYAAAAAAAACLIKYTALILPPILAVVLIVRKEARQLRVLLVPLGALLGWSLFNVYDYGATHLLNRPMPQQSWGEQAARIMSILGGLGAVAPFAASFLRSRRLMQSTVVGGAMISLSAAMLAFFFHPQGLIASVIWGVFLFLGLIAFVGAVKTLLDRAIILSEERRRLSEGPGLVLLLWLLGTIALISASAPFIAIRHVFLVLPVI